MHQEQGNGSRRQARDARGLAYGFGFVLVELLLRFLGQSEQVEIQIKYDGYIARQHDEVLRREQYEATALPRDLDYRAVGGLSTVSVGRWRSISKTTACY